MNKVKLSHLLEFAKSLNPEQVEMFSDWYNLETKKGCVVGLYFYNYPSDIKLEATEVNFGMNGKSETFLYLNYAGKTGSEAAAEWFDLTLDEMRLVTWAETLQEAITNLEKILNEEVYTERLFENSP